MRNTLLSRTPAPLERTSVMATPPLSQIPTIRLTTATPSTTDTRLANKPTTTTTLAPKAQADTRKRLVPKKSKLSLLGGSKREKSKDFSDVARRVGAPSPTIGRSFDIYVDPADDPDIGEIVVLKKKKSRAGLNDLHWGALDDVTNTGKEEASEKKTEGKKPAPAEASLKAKNDEKEKWWTIGRGRKDSKEKPKDKLRPKSKERLKENAKESSKEIAKNSTRQPAKSRRSTPPEQTRNFETRQRSQSFDAGMLFSASTDPFATNFISVPMPDEDEETPRRGHARTNTSPSLYGTRPTAPEDIAAVTQPSKDEERPKNGSIALRAIHSVRSLARIGSWAQLKNMPTDSIEQPAEKSGDKTENRVKKKKERTRSMRNSRSSLEALKNTFDSVRKSVDLSGTIRSVSSQATAVSTSSDGTVRNNRRQSGASVASTIRNDDTGSPSVEPIIGRASKSSGASTIRWNDQAGTVKERRSPGSESTSSGGTKKRRESKRSPEGRKRPGLASLFSDLRQDSSESAEAQERAKFPVQDVHSESPERESETSTTLLDISCVTSLDTPSRRVRPRPLSEQMLGRERPRGIIGDKDTGVIRILDDVTTDLASLINRLDLEATPTASPVAESPGGRSAVSDRGLLFERSPAMHPLPPSPGTPPSMPLPPVLSSEPVFRAPLPGELSELYDDAFIASDDENETKKSFDFTAELRKLDCSGAADNRSFVVQLEEAFRTPKKYSLRGLGSKLGFGNEDIPDVPPLPEKYRSAAHEIALPESPTTSEPASEGDFDDSSLSESLSLDRTHDEDICMKQPSQMSARAVFSRPSQGRLELNFKFGGNSSKGTEITVSPEESLASSDIVSTSSYHSRNQSYSSFSSAVSGNPMTMADFLAPLSNRGGNQSCSSFNSSTSGNPMTLSDIIPPPSHDSRRHSFSSVNEDESAVLKSIFAKAGNLSDVSPSVDSEGASMSGARQCALDRLTTHSRQNSDASFSGLSSYSEIRRGFEYGSSRPAFYPPPIPGTATDNSLQVPNADWRNSLLSLGSVSSYGRVLRAGAKDPFDYGVPARPISEDMSYTVDDTFSFLQRDPVRQRVDSGASNYSFDSHSHLRPDVHQRRSRRQVDSIISVTSGPPVSLYNRGFNVGRTSVTWRQRTSSFESIASSFSAQHLGRPGVGDKMFESARDLGIPLASISASPSQMESSMNWQASYDSIVDGDRDQDSLIDETGHQSLPGSQESLFGYDNHRLTHREPGLLPAHQFRPVSVYSVNSHDSPKRDDDTMISMLGGGYVRRRSIRSTLEGSPCARAEKRQQRYLGRILTRIPSGDDYDYSIEGSPDKARLISRPSFTSVHSFDTSNNNSVEGSLDKAILIKRPSFTSIFSVETADHIMDGVVEQNPDVSRLSVYDAHFGGNRMSLARKGLLERQSLENCCLSGQGEDMTNTKPSLAVFRRPEPAARIRGGSTGQASSGGDTPPLSQSRSSSQFTGSQCSIDLDRLNVLLSSSTNPVAESDRERLRRRGSGHHRRISEARASRASSVYETINEETPEIFDSLSPSGDHLKHSFDSSMAQNLSVPDINVVRWDNEDVGPALRMIHALQNEARLAVDASRRQWADTAYSVDALQSFRPPLNPAGWKALLEHSRKNFGPLPSELHGCARRSRARTVSRPSPYPRNRVFTRPPSNQRPLAPANIPVPDTKITEQVSHPLRDVSVNPNISTNAQPWEPSLSPLKPILPFSAELKGERKEAPASSEDCGPVLPVPGPRTRVLSSARKLVPGSAKRNTGKSPRKTKQNKENAAQGTSIRAESLRFVRPRPRGRPFAAPRALRV